MAYELSALAGKHEVAALAARMVGGQLVALPQGFGLVPITAGIADAAGPSPEQAFPDAFWELSASLAAHARQISRAGAIAYLEADIFGGGGTQAMVLWRAGRVGLGPERTEFQSGRIGHPASMQWAFNRALRELGARRGQAGDEFSALTLDQHRHTEEWTDRDD